MIELLEAASSDSKKTDIKLTLEQLKVLAEVLVDNEKICFVSKCFYDSFLEENYKERKEQKKRTKFDRVIDEITHSNHQNKFKLENYIEQGRPYISFIEEILKRNTEAGRIQAWQEDLSSQYLYIWADCFESFLLKPTALSIEFGKAIFSHTIGLQSLIDNLPQTRPLSEWHLPDLETIPRKSSYGRGSNYYDENKFFKRRVYTVPVNYRLPLYLLNYVARNVGKVVGGVLGYAVAFLICPYMIGQALYDCREAKKEILLKVEKAQNAKKNHEATIAENRRIISSPKKFFKTFNKFAKDPVSDSSKVSFSSPIHEGLKGRNQNEDTDEEKRYLLSSKDYSAKNNLTPA